MGYELREKHKTIVKRSRQSAVCNQQLAVGSWQFAVRQFNDHLITIELLLNDVKQITTE